MFADREASVNNLQKTGEELLNTTEDEDKKKEIEKDLERVKNLWDTLKDKTDNRKEKLDEALPVSEKFNKDMVDVMKALEELDKKVNSEDNAPSCDPIKIDEQVNDMKKLAKEVKALEPMLQAVVEDEQQLAPCCSSEDANVLQEKLDNMNEKFDKLNEDCHEKEDQLDQAKDLLDEFLNKEKELKDWMKDVENELQEKKPNGEEGEKIKKLQKDISDHKPDIDKLKELGKELKKLVKPDEYPQLKNIIEEVDDKYKKLKAGIDEDARNVFMAKEKVQDFDNKLEDLMKWTNEKSNQYRTMEPVGVQPDKIKEQMNEQKQLSNEISSKEPLFKELYDLADNIFMGCIEDEETSIRDKISNLKFNKQKLDKTSAERDEHLVDALLLAQQFSDVYHDVTSRLSNTENLLEQVDNEKSRGVEMQKEKLQNIEDNIAQLRPLMSTLQKTGADLIKLSGPGQGSDTVQKKIDECKERWDALKVASEEKGISVGAAAQQTEAVWNDVEDLIEKCQSLKDEFKKQKPVPVHEDPIEEELKKLEEQEANIKELEEPVCQSLEAIDEILKDDPKSPASSALKDRQRKLGNLWKFITGAAKGRRDSLEKSKDAAEKFWPGIEKLNDTLLDVQTKLDDQNEPGIEPEQIDELLKENQGLQDELNSNEDVIAELVEATPILVEKASPEEKTEVHHQLAHVRDQWDNLDKSIQKRQGELENVKALAVEFSNDKDHVDDWLAKAEEDLKSQDVKPSDVDELRKRLRALRAFHRDLTKHQNEITKLEQKGDSLAEKLNEDDSQKVRETVEDIIKRWDDLLDKSYEQQLQLEDALLDRGQLDFAIEELLVWVNQTKESLRTDEEIPKDKKLIEVEQSKLKIISNDVEAHKPSVENCQKAAQKIVDENSSEHPDLENKLTQLTEGWDEIQELLKQRDEKLQNAFDESQKFQSSVRELTIWLSEAKAFLKTKRPYGGKLETVEKQYTKHQDFIRVIEEREITYKIIVETFEVLIESSDVSSSRELQKSLTEITTAWTVVYRLAQDTSMKLDKALGDARLLQNRISEIEIWIVRIEGTVSMFKPVSTIYETIVIQITEIEEIYVEFGEKRNVMREIRQTADHILEHCTPDEGRIINEEIIELTEKWKTVSATLKDRKKKLDENSDQAKIFFEGSEQLMIFLDEIELKINEDQSVGKDAPAVKAQMRVHKDYQNQIGKKQTKLNAVLKIGNTLKEKSEPEDAEIIQAKIDDLCARWEVLCAISVERQHKLEEALLFHGMFQDAVYALLEWLHAVEPSLTKETAVMGDPDTVKLLIDNHKAFQKELGKRQKNYDSIVSRGETMLAEGKVDNVEEINSQLSDLRNAWEVVTQMSVTKYERLQSAYGLAKEFQVACKSCVGNLGSLEEKLKQQGPISDDLSGVKQQIEEFIIFEELLEIEEVKVNGCLKKGEVILRFCHPTSLQTIRHQVAVVKKRWNDVSGWARQRKLRLDEILIEMIEEEKIAQILMEWIVEQEVIIEEREKILLPDDYNLLTQLLNEHKVMQGDAEKKQPDYGKITKSAKRKPLTDKQRRAMAHSRGAQPQREFANPIIGVLSTKWQNLWLNLMNRQRRIQDKLDAIRIEKAAADFSWPAWRDRYNTWLNESKSRVNDMWRKKDNDKDNKLTREQFVSGVLDSGFPTEKWEVELVYDQHKRGVLITYQDFMDALKGRKRKPDKPQTEAEQIDDIIKSEVSKCTCAKAFQMFQVAERKYRFGDTQKLRLVRILRSTVMVRVGGGWETLAEFLDKNDPCRC